MPQARNPFVFKFLEGLMTLGSLPLKGFTSQLLIDYRSKHSLGVDLTTYPEP